MNCNLKLMMKLAAAAAVALALLYFAVPATQSAILASAPLLLLLLCPLSMVVMVLAMNRADGQAASSPKCKTSDGRLDKDEDHKR